METIYENLIKRISVVGNVAIGMRGEDAEELRQDAMLMALREVHRLSAEGRKESASSIAYYAIQRVKAGRRSYGVSVTDAYAPAAQLMGRSQLESTVIVTDENGNSEEVEFVDQLASRSDVATEVARRIDWEEFIGALPPVMRATLIAVIMGARTGELAMASGVSPAAITSRKRAIAQRLRDAWGDDVLADIGKPPRWVRERQHE